MELLWGNGQRWCHSHDYEMDHDCGCAEFWLVLGASEVHDTARKGTAGACCADYSYAKRSCVCCLSFLRLASSLGATSGSFI